MRQVRLAVCCSFIPLLLQSQTAPGISNDRILGIIPNFATVNDPDQPYVPLRTREKWQLFVKESVDPFTFTAAAMGAAMSQRGNQNPKYGTGFTAYAQRFGAAQADFTTQNFFSDAVLAPLLHEDPRYFRKGPGSPVLIRIVYAMSRVIVARRDSGRDGFAFSGILGMGMGIALSDAYYPRQSVGGGELQLRVITSLESSALGNLLPEFWPDVRQKLAKWRRKPTPSEP